jgi:hypothetical protein
VIVVNFFLSDDVFLSLDVDTIEELTDILVLDEAKLVDLSGLLRNVFNGVAFKDELILGNLNVGTVDLNGGADFLLADALLTQEVTDFDGLTFNGDVDREVSAGEAELIAEALSNTSDQVLDGGEASVDASQISAATEPADDGELRFLGVDADIQVQVREVLRKGTTGALNGEVATLAGDGNTSGDGELADGLDLHMLEEFFGCFF